MKTHIRIFSFFAAAALLFLLCGCGAASPGSTQTEATTLPPLRKIGCIVPDSATVGSMTYRMLADLRQAAQETDGFDTQILLQTGITDAAVPEGEKLPPPTTQTTTSPPEPESFTDKDGKVYIEAVPVTPASPLTASYAASRLIEDACEVIVFADARYDAFSAWLAEKYPDLYVLQYEGKETNLSNRQTFSIDARAPFYMPGAVAAARGDMRIGFTAGRDTAQNRACINAFALGAASENEKTQIIVRFLGADSDLVLERTVPAMLLEEDGCTLLAQSVLTALPVAAAAEKKAACIGFGYDMAADGGAQYVCSVVLHFDVFFRQALSAVADGSFSAAVFQGNAENGAASLSELHHATDAMGQALSRSEKAAEKTDVFRAEPSNITILQGREKNGETD